MDINSMLEANRSFGTDRFDKFAFNPFAKSSSQSEYIDPRELERQRALEAGTVAEPSQGYSTEADPNPPGTGYAYTGQLNASNYPTLDFSTSLSNAIGLSDAESQGIGGMRGTAGVRGNNIGNIGAQIGIGLLGSLLGLSAPLTAINKGLEFSGKRSLTQTLADMFAPSNNELANIAEQTNTPIGLQAIAAAMMQADEQARENNPGFANLNAMAAVDAFNNAASIYGGGYNAFGSDNLADAVASGNWGGSADADAYGGYGGGSSLSDSVSSGSWGGSADSDV